MKCLSNQSLNHTGVNGDDDLTQVAEAAAAGRVATLLIEADREISGRLDGVTGQVELADLDQPQVDDLLDDLGERDWLPLTGTEPTTTTTKFTTENNMQIQLNTDANIDGDEALATEVNRSVESALNRFSDQITRVEVQLSDENSDKKRGNDDMRCIMEARMEGRQPVAVTHHGATVDQAVDGAADKLHRMIESTLGRLRDQ